MRVVWRVPVELPAWGSPVVYGDRVVFGLGNGRLGQSDEHPAGAVICVDAATGHELWRHRTQDGVFARPCVDATTVYCTSRDGTITALDRDGGKVQWSRSLGSAVVTTPARLGDRLYVTASSGRPFALNAATGDVLATFDVAAHAQARAQVYSSPAVFEEPDTGRHQIIFGAELLTGTRHVAAIYAIRY
jgi:outer membrane protein assembly factor BamB